MVARGCDNYHERSNCTSQLQQPERSALIFSLCVFVSLRLFDMDQSRYIGKQVVNLPKSGMRVLIMANSQQLKLRRQV
jgi:hypothetical protein